MKRIAKAGMAVGILFGSALVAYAITSLLFTQSQTSSFQKKTIFRFNLSTGLTSAEIGPGDSFSTSPLIYNDATEDMYVFIKVEMPTVDSGEKLYAFDLNSSWVEVEDGVYAYGSEEMTTLAPGASTTALTEQMTMKPITNAVWLLSHRSCCALFLYIPANTLQYVHASFGFVDTSSVPIA